MFDDAFFVGLYFIIGLFCAKTFHSNKPYDINDPKLEGSIMAIVTMIWPICLILLGIGYVSEYLHKGFLDR